MVIAYVGVGSNQGGRAEWIRRVVDSLRKLDPAVRVLRTSPLYETPPLVEGDIAAEEKDPERIPWFLNGVIEVETTLAVEELFEELRKIEEQLGRTRPGGSQPSDQEAARPFLSRSIDLDLLFYGNEIIETEALTVPHPRAHLRSFVMLPMRDLRSDYVHPVLERTVGELCEETFQKLQNQQ